MNLTHFAFKEIRISPPTRSAEKLFTLLQIIVLTSFVHDHLSKLKLQSFVDMRRFLLDKNKLVFIHKKSRNVSSSPYTNSPKK